MLPMPAWRLLQPRTPAHSSCRRVYCHAAATPLSSQLAHRKGLAGAPGATMSPAWCTTSCADLASASVLATKCWYLRAWVPVVTVQQVDWRARPPSTETAPTASSCSNWATTLSSAAQAQAQGHVLPTHTRQHPGA